MAIAEEELREHLREQVEYLEASCAAFDAGHQIEAKRLATHVRTLVHDTGASTSLLQRLRVKESVLFLDGVNPEAVRLLEDPDFSGSAPGLAVVAVSGDEAGFVPLFTVPGRNYTPLPFEQWWKSIRLRSQTGVEASRRNIVLWLANKDGGAHIDELPAPYRGLSREGAMGFTFSSNSTTSPVAAAMRQIAHELLLSLKAARLIPA